MMSTPVQRPFLRFQPLESGLLAKLMAARRGFQPSAITLVNRLGTLDASDATNADHTIPDVAFLKELVDSDQQSRQYCNDSGENSIISDADMEASKTPVSEVGSGLLRTKFPTASEISLHFELQNRNLTITASHDGSGAAPAARSHEDMIDFDAWDKFAERSTPSETLSSAQWTPDSVLTPEDFINFNEWDRVAEQTTPPATPASTPCSVQSATDYAQAEDLLDFSAWDRVAEQTTPPATPALTTPSAQSATASAQVEDLLDFGAWDRVAEQTTHPATSTSIHPSAKSVTSSAQAEDLLDFSAWDRVVAHLTPPISTPISTPSTAKSVSIIDEVPIRSAPRPKVTPTSTTTSTGGSLPPVSRLLVASAPGPKQPSLTPPVEPTWTPSTGGSLPTVSRLLVASAPLSTLTPRVTPASTPAPDVSVPVVTREPVSSATRPEPPTPLEERSDVEDDPPLKPLTERQEVIFTPNTWMRVFRNVIRGFGFEEWMDWWHHPTKAELECRRELQNHPRGLQRYQWATNASNRTLGTGSFGKVVETKGPENAVKSVNMGWAAEDRYSWRRWFDRVLEARKTLETELFAMSMIRHPNVMRHETFWVDPCGLNMFLCFPKMDCSLADYVRIHGKLADAQLKSLMTCLFAALKACHAQNLIHLDVKPENILVQVKDELSFRLADFGCAQVSNGRENVAMGTMAYMPPECADLNWKPCKVMPGSDTWAAGVLLMEMRDPEIAGAYGDTYMERVARIVEVANSRPEWAVWKGLLSAKPSSRMTMADALEIAENMETFVTATKPSSAWEV